MLANIIILAKLLVNFYYVQLPQEYFNQLACMNAYSSTYETKYIWHDGCYVLVNGRWINVEDLSSQNNWSGSFGP